MKLTSATGIFVLDSQGLTLAIAQDAKVTRWLATAKTDGGRIITSATTLVEVIHPKSRKTALEWTLSLMEVVPVTEQLARKAAQLLQVAGKHGHKDALDAIVTATSLAQSAPVTILTSDPEDLITLCQNHVTVVKV